MRGSLSPPGHPVAAGHRGHHRQRRGCHPLHHAGAAGNLPAGSVTMMRCRSPVSCRCPIRMHSPEVMTPRQTEAYYGVISCGLQTPPTSGKPVRLPALGPWRSPAWAACRSIPWATGDTTVDVVLIDGRTAGRFGELVERVQTHIDPWQRSGLGRVERPHRRLLLCERGGGCGTDPSMTVRQMLPTRRRRQ